MIILSGVALNIDSILQKRVGFFWEALSLKQVNPLLVDDSTGEISTTGLDGEAF